jgi:glyoxylate reductase
MNRIFVTRSWPGRALEQLTQAGYEVEVWPEFTAPAKAVLMEKLKDASAVITTVEDPLDAEVISAAGPSLRIIAQAAVGYDNIDTAAARARGIRVSNTPGVLTDATADLAFALLAAVARRVVAGMDYVRDAKWTAWHPALLLGPELYGATVGVVGFGRIGQAFAKRCRGFDMKVLYSDRAPKPPEVTQGAEYRPVNDLFAEVDFLSLHTPLTPETHHLVNRERLALMKPTAVLVNTARGRVVDTEALVEAVKAGQLGGVGLDVTDPEPLPASHPLLSLPNVIVTPHIGSAGQTTRERMAAMAVANSLAVLAGAEPPNAVV